VEYSGKLAMLVGSWGVRVKIKTGRWYNVSGLKKYPLYTSRSIGREAVQVAQDSTWI